MVIGQQYCLLLVNRALGLWLNIGGREFLQLELRLCASEHVPLHESRSKIGWVSVYIHAFNKVHTKLSIPLSFYPFVGLPVCFFSSVCSFHSFLCNVFSFFFILSFNPSIHPSFHLTTLIDCLFLDLSFCPTCLSGQFLQQSIPERPKSLFNILDYQRFKVYLASTFRRWSKLFKRHCQCQIRHVSNIYFCFKYLCKKFRLCSVLGKCLS